MTLHISVQIKHQISNIKLRISCVETPSPPFLPSLVPAFLSILRLFLSHQINQIQNHCGIDQQSDQTDGGKFFE